MDCGEEETMATIRLYRGLEDKELLEKKTIDGLTFMLDNGKLSGDEREHIQNAISLLGGTYD